MSEKHNVARIYVPYKEITAWLDFEGGRILRFQTSDVYDGLEIVMEHPDLPEIEEGFAIPIVHPEYFHRYNEKGEDLGHIRIEPKKGG